MRRAELEKTLREKSLNDVTGNVGHSKVAKPVAIRALFNHRCRAVTLDAYTADRVAKIVDAEWKSLCAVSH